jgi:2-octaprenyl-6-methoxyphenol hydroxylase
MAGTSRQHYDVIISGAGLVGLTLGLALGASGMRIALLDSQGKDKLLDQRWDGRVSAITFGSRNVFKALGVWDAMANDAGEIHDIRILDSHSPLFLHYDHRLVGNEPMGHIVENRHLRRALFRAVERHKNITLLAPMAHRHAAFGPERATLTLKGGRKIRAALLVAAEGRQSALREAAGIRTYGWDYGQSAIVCTVKHENHHHGVAVEHFLPAGPFAILPMGGGHHSSLVWTETRATAPHYMAMDDASLSAAIAQRFGSWLGKVEIVGGRWCYPLSLLVAARYVAPRLALVGDSAHAIHPIAGQGFNLGIRDAAELAEKLTDHFRLGLDVGEAPLLAGYERARMADNHLMIGMTDGLNRLFSNNRLPVKLARQCGLSAVEQLPPLKKFFMRHAMGAVGHRPRLMHGQPL